jgi:hypothetical protein
MAPELNNGTGSLTVNGVTIPHSGAFYISGAIAQLTGPYISDASASPDFNIVSNGNLTITDMQGSYGAQFNPFIVTDGTGLVNLNGQWLNSGAVNGVTSWPTTINGLRGALAGSPISTLNSTIPNAFTASSPLAPAFTSCTGCTSSGTVTDSQFGLVSQVVFPSTAETSCGTGCAVINNIVPSGYTSVSSDYLWSGLFKSSVTAAFDIYCHYSGGDVGFKFAAVTLYAGQWTRVVGYNYGIASGSECDFQMFENDTNAATVEITRIESLATPNGSGTGAQTRALVVQTGAVGTPFLSSVLQGPNGTCSAPTYSFATQTSDGMYTDGSGNVGICRQGTSVGAFLSTGFSAPGYRTGANCAQNGTAANPSVVSCGANIGGYFSCSATASAGTCTVNTTAVTASSTVILTPATAYSSALGITCNSSVTFGTTPILGPISAGTSFTINMPTATGNPVCFSYFIVN